MGKVWAQPQRQQSDQVETDRSAIMRDNLINWKRGDMALHITHKMQAERDKEVQQRLLADFLTEMNETKKSFDNLRWIAQTYPTAIDRDIPVSWTHFRLAARLDPATLRLLLQRAADESWSTRQMETSVRAVRAECLAAQAREQESQHQPCRSKR